MAAGAEVSEEVEEDECRAVVKVVETSAGRWPAATFYCSALRLTSNPAWTTEAVSLYVPSSGVVVYIENPA